MVLTTKLYVVLLLIFVWVESFRLRFRAGKVGLRKERKSKKSRCGKEIFSGSFAFVLGGALVDGLTDRWIDKMMDQWTEETDQLIDGRTHALPI